MLHLPMFEGPLDLLLYLIEKNRFTLSDLEICPIIDQYLAYIERIRSLDISLAGEFLDMASYLIWLKSRLLLPLEAIYKDEEGKNPADELREMLLAYQSLKVASRELGYEAHALLGYLSQGNNCRRERCLKDFSRPLDGGNCRYPFPHQAAHHECHAHAVFHPGYHDPYCLTLFFKK
ncbi:MAG: segregation/condensation protein A [Desulfosudis oleivorans]|nr:segregation/condensation protein A [Desulfosudis oleivorans]